MSEPRKCLTCGSVLTPNGSHGNAACIAALRERCAAMESDLALRATIIRGQRRVAVEAAKMLRVLASLVDDRHPVDAGMARNLADRLESQS